MKKNFCNFFKKHKHQWIPDPVKRIYITNLGEEVYVTYRCSCGITRQTHYLRTEKGKTNEHRIQQR